MKILRAPLVLICFLLAGNLCQAQKAEDLIGAWQVADVELSGEASLEETQMLPVVKPVFLKSEFLFKADNSFSFNSPDKDLATDNAIWEFDAAKKYIHVYERRAKGKPGQLMGITVQLSDGRYRFHLEETPLILTVIRN